MANIKNEERPVSVCWADVVNKSRRDVLLVDNIPRWLLNGSQGISLKEPISILDAADVASDFAAYSMAEISSPYYAMKEIFDEKNGESGWGIYRYIAPPAPMSMMTARTPLGSPKLMCIVPGFTDEHHKLATHIKDSLNTTDATK